MALQTSAPWPASLAGAACRRRSPPPSLSLRRAHQAPPKPNASSSNLRTCGPPQSRPHKYSKLSARLVCKRHTVDPSDLMYNLNCAGEMPCCRLDLNWLRAQCGKVLLKT